MLVIARQEAAFLRGGGDASWWSKTWKRDLSATFWARAANMISKCVNLTEQVEAADQWNAVRAQVEEKEGGSRKGSRRKWCRGGRREDGKMRGRIKSPFRLSEWP